MNKALITGGAGFIGTNLALALSKEKWQVTALDNLSRRGTNVNLKYLKDNISPKLFKFVKADIRDSNISQYLNVDAVFHLAAQTAVTTSLIDPKHDFDVNASGTFNVLNALRLNNPSAVFIYASTNKVYGSLWHLKKNPAQGIDETCPLDFHSPYGVSKGVGDSYTKDFARIYNLNTVVLRQSCIYGMHQLGVEDQGWVAHLGARAIIKKPLNLYGTGTQTRDLLYIDDLIDAYLRLTKNIKKVKGEVFNIGGGPQNAISVKNYFKFLEKYTGRKLKLNKFPPRPGDQSYFVSDNAKIKKLLNWTPATSIETGLPIMLGWIAENKKLFEKL